MAGGKTYGVGAVTVFAGAKTDIINLVVGKEGTIQGFGSDGDLFQKLRWAEDLWIRGSFDTTDISGVTSLTVGAVGVIVFTFRLRVKGSGFAASPSDIVATITDAIIEPFEFSAPHSGMSNSSVPFSAASVDGTTSPLAIT